MIGNKIILGSAGNAGTSGPYWISTWGGSGAEYGVKIEIDSADNIYVIGYTNSTGAGLNDVLITKYNSSGTIQWQRTLGGASNDYGISIAIDSADNVYVAGYTNSTGAGGDDALIAKYNSTGTLQWQRRLGGTGNDYGYGIAIDSADNIYVIGYTFSTGAGGSDFLITKYNSSGTIQWQRVLGGASSDYGRRIAIDSADNVYVAGSTFSTGAGGQDVLIAKYNSSGTIQWQRTLGGAGTDASEEIAIDSSDNIYIVGRTNSTGAGSYDLLIAKYNTSGTIQWQRTLGGASDDYGNSIVIDSADNIYVIGYTNSTGAGLNDFLIAKYNTSGTIQWQRVLGGVDHDVANSIAIDSSNNIYTVGYTSSTGAGGYDLLIAKLPNDGTLTGTYGVWTYQSSALTDATSSLTDSAAGLTSASSSLTDASSSLTDLGIVQYFQIA